MSTLAEKRQALRALVNNSEGFVYMRNQRQANYLSAKQAYMNIMEAEPRDMDAARDAFQAISERLDELTDADEECRQYTWAIGRLQDEIYELEHA